MQAVAALQNEYSRWWRTPETNGTLQPCAQLAVYTAATACTAREQISRARVAGYAACQWETGRGSIAATTPTHQNNPLISPETSWLRAGVAYEKARLSPWAWATMRSR